MTITCPQCGSTEFTKLSLVYAQGFSDVMGRTRGWGLGFGFEGATLGFGRAKTRRRLQSKLSQAVSPPRKRSYLRVIKWGTLVSAMVWWVLFYLTAVPGGPKTITASFPLIACFNGGVLFFALWIVWRNNRIVFPKRYANWDRCFMCRRCGHVTSSLCNSLLHS
jgi:hypothetical protein